MSSAAATAKQDDPEAYLNTPAAIGRILNQLATNRVPLEVRLPRADTDGTSMILEVADDSHYFVLDEFVPHTLNDKVRKDDVVCILTSLAEVDVRFESRITATGMEGEIPFYRVPFPDTAYYPQRRAVYRASVPMQWTSKVRFKAANDASIDASLRDLSVGGFCCQLEDDAVAILRQLAEPLTCELHVDAEEPLPVKVALCHERRSTRKSVWLGARYIELPKPDERRIERWIADITRQQARVR